MTYMIADPDAQSGIELKKLLDGYAMLDFQGSYITLGAAKANIRGHPPDVAFIRCGKAELNAFRLAGELKEQSLSSKLIFVGDNAESAVEAFEHEADGFLLIPFDQGAIGKLVRSFGSGKKDRKQL